MLAKSAGEIVASARASIKGRDGGIASRTHEPPGGVSVSGLAASTA